MSGSVAAVRRTTRLFVVLVTSLAAMAASALAYADGVDVSHWQGSMSWTKVKAAGMQFAFMKATESTTYTDTQFATNWAGAQAVGLYRGAYHFARPSTSAGSAAKQAEYFVSRVGVVPERRHACRRCWTSRPPVGWRHQPADLDRDLAHDGRAAHRPGPDDLRLPGLLGGPPRQQHRVHPLPAVDRPLRRARPGSRAAGPPGRSGSAPAAARSAASAARST